jgi:hypothetical protein
MPGQSWGALFGSLNPNVAAPLTDPLDQPTGATTTGSGRKADQSIPALQQAQVTALPGPAPVAVAPSNTWTQIGSSTLRGTPPDPWVKPGGHDDMPGLSPEHRSIMADTVANIGAMDAYFARMRKALEPKPWSTVAAGGIGTGLQMGSIGAGTIYPTRCMLQGVHNPSSAPVTFSVTDCGSGDPMPKYSGTVAPGTTSVIGTQGLYFPHGIMLMVMSAGGVLTFFGVDAAE